MATSKKTIASIQLLRGVASLLVVFLHITVNYNNVFATPLLGNFFLFGGSGVDIFFVLSGFIITYTNLGNAGNKAAIGGFVKRRLIRIFPVYWLIISIFVLLQVLLPAFYKTPFDLSFSNMVATYLLLPGHMMVNGVSWSLTNELFFYLLFIIALLIPHKRISLYLMLVYLALLLVFGIANYSFENSHLVYAFIWNPMNIEFFLGVISAILYSKLNGKLAWPFFIVGMLWFIAGILINNHHMDIYSTAFNRVLLFGMPSFFIILGITVLERQGKTGVHQLFLQLGDASYSIYLFHLPVVAAFFKILQYLKITDPYLTGVSLCFLILLICIAGVLIYHKIEKPLIGYLNKIFIKR